MSEFSEDSTATFWSVFGRGTCSSQARNCLPGRVACVTKKMNLLFSEEELLDS